MERYYPYYNTKLTSIILTTSIIIYARIVKKNSLVFILFLQENISPAKSIIVYEEKSEILENCLPKIAYWQEKDEIFYTQSQPRNS